MLYDHRQKRPLWQILDNKSFVALCIAYGPGFERRWWYRLRLARSAALAAESPDGGGEQPAINPRHLQGGD